ncbi:hypothetical protein CERZMDRAFT_99643 [Cercospora zeae-maydis SCOH1-5]|uniref:Uncharacterized protein n=1 Tax=Cercospora zeae-maydis SCOH1-5 TaxID=717836 RepID=A0A6A6F9Y3_9PEZI|nr:hypothetical protein CERZMDRAFT_99643 [Cercospora zeae-maydis SCOH1-5]
MAPVTRTKSAANPSASVPAPAPAAPAPAPAPARPRRRPPRAAAAPAPTASASAAVPSAAPARPRAPSYAPFAPRTRHAAPVSLATGKFRTPEPTEGPPVTAGMFTPLVKVPIAAPGSTPRVYRQVVGISFPMLGPLLREGYVRYVGDEHNQKGRVEQLPTLSIGARTVRETLGPRRLVSIPRTISSSSSSDYESEAPAVPYIPPETRKIALRKPFMQSWRGLLSWLALLLFASLVLVDPGNWQASLNVRKNTEGGSDGNARRIVIDPLGTSHIEEVSHITLSVNEFCKPNRGGPGTTSGIANKVNLSVRNFLRWNDLMRQSTEPELRYLYDMFYERVKEANRTVELSKDVEARMCKFADDLMNQGLGYEDTRSFAARLRGYRERAKTLRPAKGYEKAKQMWGVAKSSDWDHDLVEGVFTDLKQYLLKQQQLASTMALQSREIFKKYARFISSYRIYQEHPGNAEHKRQRACMSINARKWLWFSFNCDKLSHSSLLSGVEGDRDFVIRWSVASQYYLKEAQTIWGNYAKHLEDGLSLLEDLPKLKKALSAEGIPARIEHLTSLLDNLANQADNTAMLLQDAYERKYTVPVDFEPKLDDRVIPGMRPTLGPCTSCNERSLSSWSSSSSMAALSDEAWSSLFESEQSAQTAIPTWASMKATHHTGSHDPQQGPETTTATQRVKVVNVIG